MLTGKTSNSLDFTSISSGWIIGVEKPVLVHCRPKIADNEEGIKEVKKKKGLEAQLFVYLHCSLEA